MYMGVFDHNGKNMRLTDDRYANERTQFELALRMIRHEARTRTIRECTGLSDDRIRKLYCTYFRNSGVTGTRSTSCSRPRSWPFTTPGCCCASTIATGFIRAGPGPMSNSGIACAGPSKPTCYCTTDPC